LPPEGTQKKSERLSRSIVCTMPTREEVMKITSFKDMYIAELQELMSLEQQLGQALIRMVEAASHPSL